MLRRCIQIRPVASNCSTPGIKVHPDVQAALRDGRPVVALESTIITHGLPQGQNLEVARSLERIIRSEGVTPATVAVIRGTPCVGIDDEELEFIAMNDDSIKASRRDLSLAVTFGKTAGTTVSGTMTLASAAGIDVFATGGIGGVHRGAIEGNDASFDVSADLIELGRTPMMVVCAGVKSILDIPRTLEYLETQTVPVATLSSNTGKVEFPAFYTPQSGIETPAQLYEPTNAAMCWITHRDLLKQQSGFIVAVPPRNLKPEDQVKIMTSIDIALKEAAARGISGKQVTPFILSRMNELSEGASLRANVALVENNARVAAQIAYQLNQRRRSGSQAAYDAFDIDAAVPLPNSIDDTSKTHAIIAGSSNMDIISKVRRTVRHDGSSNQATVTTTPGGVGRNLAEAYARLTTGNNYHFISFVGDDFTGQQLAKSITKLGYNKPRILAGRKSVIYNGILQPQGKVATAAIGNIEINQQPHFQLSETDKTALQNASIFLTDLNMSANITSAILDALPEDVIRIAEPTMNHLVGRLREIGMERFDVITPNLNEFYHIVGRQDSDVFFSGSELDLQELVLLATSSEWNHFPENVIILITLAEHGILAIDRKSGEVMHYSIEENEKWGAGTVTNVSGSGDTFAAGVAKKLEGKRRADLKFEDIDVAVKFGLECAQYSLRSDSGISPQLHPNIKVSNWSGRRIELIAADQRTTEATE